MNFGFEQLGRAQSAMIDNLFGLGHRLNGQFEKIARQQLETGLEAARESLSAAQALYSVKDGETFAAWHATHFQPGVDRASSSARVQYELMIETRNLVADALKQSSSEFTRQAQETLDNLAKEAPEGFEQIFAAAKSALAAQVAALESIGKVTDQMSDMAEANVFAMKSAAVQAVKATTGGAKRKAA